MIGIKSDRIIVGEGLFDGYIYAENGIIIDVTREKRDADACYDFSGKYVSPGFIDTHTHGGGGYSFYCTDADEIAMACNFHMRHGTTTVCPTISACPYEDIISSLKAFKEAKDSGKIESNAIGMHIEGPYLSASQCGAQPPIFITPPIKAEYEDIVSRYGDHIARWTYAPENDKDGAFCRYITSKGIIASAGHTEARYPDMALAIENGCNLVTHLYSCTSTVTRDHGFRNLGVIESAFLRDELYAELICDGKHLPPDLIRMIVKIKGTERVILTTDSLSVAGVEARESSNGVIDYIVEDGVAKLPDRSAFAGSIATADVLIRTLTKECGYGIVESVKMLTAVPAELFSLNKGAIKTGLDADIIVFDGDITVSDVFVMGKKTV